jgi:hypothetical protein
MTDIPKDKPAKRRINLPPERSAAGAGQPVSPPPPPPTRRNARGLTRLFIACFLIGTALAILGHAPALAVVGVAGPVAMTILYPVLGLGLIRNHPSLREKLADNSYYLGFMFTQVALFVAFAVPVILGTEVGGADVMRGFGVAIGASMTGLMVRTALMQTGHTAAENADLVEEGVEALAREVEELTRGVSRHTGSMLNDLRGMAEDLGQSRTRFGEEMRQWVAETTARLADFDAALKGQLGASQRGADRVAEAALAAEADLSSVRSSLTDRLVETLSALQKMREGLEAQVGAASRSVGESADDFRKGMAAVDEMQAALRGRIAETSGVIQAAADRLSSGMATLKGLAAVDDLVGVLDQRAGRVSEGVDKLAQAVSEAAGRTQEASARGVSEIGAASQRGTAAVESAQEEALANARQAYAEAVRKSSADLGEDLNLAVKALETVLSDFRRELERVRV